MYDAADDGDDDDDAFCWRKEMPKENRKKETNKHYNTDLIYARLAIFNNIRLNLSTAAVFLF